MYSDYSLSAGSKFELADILYSGIYKDIERNDLPIWILEEMVDFYRKNCLFGSQGLIDKLEEIKKRIARFIF